MRARTEVCSCGFVSAIDLVQLICGPRYNDYTVSCSAFRGRLPVFAQRLGETTVPGRSSCSSTILLSCSV